ncbi:class I SAM-dependent methyltransferase [Actinopolymorpha pittospori]
MSKTEQAKGQAGAPASPTEAARAMWAAGDYHRLGTRIMPVSEELALALDIRPGERLLDIAGGSGNTALAAARRDARVTCTDIVPPALDHARRRAGVEFLAIETEVADAESLPYADDTFDVVTSTFGIQFATDQEKAAGEMLRVLRPGGRLGLATWTPNSALSGLLALAGKYAPPPEPTPSPMRWGTRQGLTELLGDAVTDQRVEILCIELTAPSYAEQFRRFREWVGPVRTALARMSPDAANSFEADFTDLWHRHNRGEPDAVVVPVDYLQVVMTRKAAPLEPSPESSPEPTADSPSEDPTDAPPEPSA